MSKYAIDVNILEDDARTLLDIIDRERLAHQDRLVEWVLRQDAHRKCAERFTSHHYPPEDGETANATADRYGAEALAAAQAANTCFKLRAEVSRGIMIGERALAFAIAEAHDEALAENEQRDADGPCRECGCTAKVCVVCSFNPAVDPDGEDCLDDTEHVMTGCPFHTSYRRFV